MCVFYFTLNFIIASFFYIFFFFIQQVDSLEKGKLSCFILCSKNSPPFDQSFKLCAFSLLYADPFYTWLTIYIYSFVLLCFLLRTWTCVCDSRFSFNKPLNFYVLGFIFNQFVVVCLGVSKIIIIMVKHQNRNFWVHKTRPMRAFSPVRESTFRFSLSINYLEAKKKILFSINIINEYYINRHAHLNLFSFKYAQSTGFYSCSVLFFAYIMCPYKTKKVDFIASTHLLQS